METGTTIYIGVAEGEELDLRKKKGVKVHDLGLFTKGKTIKDLTPEMYKESIEKISKAVWESMQDDSVATLKSE